MMIIFVPRNWAPTHAAFGRFMIMIYWFQVPCILTDDERLINGMQKFDRMD